MMKLKLIAWGIGITTVAATGLIGLIYLVNLPYPMVRRPVSKIAPLLLLPSYIEMDHHYREAIAHVEQADQLIHKVSSFDDIILGEKKVKLAQKNLNKLPVWFIGYEPKRYCQMFSCSWQFTIDEFEMARKQIGRMDAIIFQEKNAYNTYQKVEAELQQIKHNYKTATNSQQKQTMIVAWQSVLDQLKQLPPQTLAATLASAKLEAYQRDFQTITGEIRGNKNANTIIQGAKNFSLAATNLCENPPHRNEKWQKCSQLWKKAIQRLEIISPQDAGYLESQKLLADYHQKMSIVELRAKTEKESVDALDNAKEDIQRIQTIFASGINLDEKKRFTSELQGTVEQLRQVEAGTTVYSEAQELLKFAQVKLQEVTNENNIFDD